MATYSSTVKRWCEEWDVRACPSCNHYRSHNRGYVEWGSRTVHYAAGGHTRSTLFTWAHEIGHVACAHNGRVPRYEEEYEATVFAVKLLRREDIPVPIEKLRRFRRYVLRKIRGRERAGRAVKSSIREWASH